MSSVTKQVLADLRYLTPHDANMRLKDTVVTYDGEAVYCKGTVPGYDPNGLSVMCIRLKDGKDFICHSSDVLLDLTSLPLGWVGGEGKSPIFLARTTRTSQRQGIHLGSTLTYGLYGIHMGFSWDNYIDLRPLNECFKNTTFKISEVAGFEFGGPLNREWALVRKPHDKFFTIFHRSIPVGTYFPQRKEFFFRRGRLTKTRRMQIQEIFDSNKNAGVRYAVTEQV